ncbi:uncharacterized protein CXorf65 homolog [Patiria miniata]|uniref:Uncharacterized protein n=1 Tax=Patiria miniata TaxID=46514 RepID=A0A914AP65_PATMI|nr:uncharacterized protein CXorf65 homolog [Patiria miniata]
MFITVRFGEKEEALFNPNCRTLLLLENIKQRCNCAEDVDVDLSDNEGNVKHLLETPLRYANEVLKERETLVLVRVEKNEGNQKPHYVPLLNDVQAIDAAFMARLSTKENLGSGSAKGSRRKNAKKDGTSKSSSRAGAKSTTPTGRKGSKR